MQGDHYVEYNNGVPTQVRQFNSPTISKNVAKVLGIFLQDSWSIEPTDAEPRRPLGSLRRHAAGAVGAGRTASSVPRTVPETEVLNQNIGVWRAGAAYDLTGNGRTALKASYSRYGLQVGIDRVTAVNPLSNGNRTCPWTDPNGDGMFQESEVTVSQCAAFTGGVGFRYADGINWPYSDEATVGFETQLPGDVRFGTMYYYRTNREQFGQRNMAVPTSVYTPFTLQRPERPRRHARQPGADDGHRLQHSDRLQRSERHGPRQRGLPRHRPTTASSSPAPSASRRTGRCRPA